MNADCEVCCGRRTIRLPLYPRLSAATAANAAVAISSELSYRDYPCPECSDTVPEHRVAIVQRVAQFDSRRIDDPDYLAHIREHAAFAIVDQLLKDDFLTVEWGKEDRRLTTRSVRVTLGVVSKLAVASLEERIARRQDEVANEVVAEAIKRIDIWGRDTGATRIYKDQAKDTVRDALTRVLNAREASLPHPSA